MGQFANPHLDNAKAMEAELNYEEMPEELAAALSQPGNTPAELIEIYRLLGMAHLALRDTDKAKYAFIKLLTLDPTFQMPSSENPRFRKAFGDIKAEFEATGRVTVAYEPPEWSDLNVGEAPASFPVQFQVTDKYEQVVSATVELTLTVNGNKGSPVQTKLSPSGRNGNITIFAGQVSNPGASFPAGTIQYYEIAYALVLENQTKKRLDLNPPFVPVVLKIGDPGATMNEPQKTNTVGTTLATTTAAQNTTRDRSGTGHARAASPRNVGKYVINRDGYRGRHGRDHWWKPPGVLLCRR